jgi:hypothetical protein
MAMPIMRFKIVANYCGAFILKWIPHVGNGNLARLNLTTYFVDFPTSIDLGNIEPWLEGLVQNDHPIYIARSRLAFPPARISGPGYKRHQNRSRLRSSPTRSQSPSCPRTSYIFLPRRSILMAPNRQLCMGNSPSSTIHETSYPNRNRPRIISYSKCISLVKRNRTGT